jgi:hypothetical protein
LLIQDDRSYYLQRAHGIAARNWPRARGTLWRRVL